MIKRLFIVIAWIIGVPTVVGLTAWGLVAFDPTPITGQWFFAILEAISLDLWALFIIGGIIFGVVIPKIVNYVKYGK